MTAPRLDSERMTFLRALDDAPDVDVTDFEARFIERALRYQTTSPAFSEKQREVVDEMFRTYGHRVPMSPHKPQIANLRLPETQPGKCAWLLTREGAARQTRCGGAVGAGRIFCPDHEQERARVAAQMKAANRRRH